MEGSAQDTGRYQEKCKGEEEGVKGFNAVSRASHLGVGGWRVKKKKENYDGSVFLRSWTIFRPIHGLLAALASSILDWPGNGRFDWIDPRHF